MKLPYSEGSVFLVPLTDGGYARGVVARSGPKGKVLFGYILGPVCPRKRGSKSVTSIRTRRYFAVGSEISV